MSEAEMRALISALTVELKDLIQAQVEEMLGINVGEVVLNQGTTVITFANYTYDTADEWELIKCIALASSDGAQIDCEIASQTNEGFEVTVSEACTFKYRTGYKGLNINISD